RSSSHPSLPPFPTRRSSDLYLSRAEVTGVWRRLAGVLHEFRSGRYLSDLHLGSVQNVEVRAFRVLLSAFVRGRVHLHFGDPEQEIGRAPPELQSLAYLVCRL